MNRSVIFEALFEIEGRLRDRLTADDIAADAYFSKYHFGRQFREYVGDSVMDYVKKRRLSLAAKDVCHGRDTILEIALRHGYNSHEGFTRAFKTFYGITPSDCRRYGISLLSRQPYIKEMSLMSANNTRYDNSIDEIMRALNGFVAEARQIAELIEKAVAGTRFSNFLVIGRETQHLAEKVQSGCEAIGNMNDAYSRITKRYEIMMMLEDVAFQANILAFNMAIQVGRTAQIHKEPFSPIAERYVGLAKTAAEIAGKASGIMEQLADLIHEDTVKQAWGAIHSMQAKTKHAISIGEQVCDFIAKTAPEIDGGNYMVISEELRSHLDNLSEHYKQAAADMPNDVLAARETVSALNESVKEFMFNMNITLLECRLDLMRCPDEESVKLVVFETEKLIGNYLEIMGECNSDNKELHELCDKIKNKPVPRSGCSPEKYLDSIFFQISIIKLYARTEFAKMNFILSDEQRGELAKIAEDMRAVLKRVHELKRLPEVQKADFAALSESIGAIARELQRHADSLGERGGVLQVFAKECGNLSQRIAAV